MVDGKPVPQLLTIDDVGRLGRVSTRTVRRWIAAGVLRAVRRGRVVRVLSEDVLTFLAENRIHPT
jgi:excisionase family DNA binding protein